MTDFVPIHHEGLTFPDGSLTPAGRLFHENSHLKLGFGGTTGPLLRLLSHLKSSEGDAETERIAWRLVLFGRMSAREPHVQLLHNDVHLPNNSLEQFDRIVVQRILSLAGFLTYSRSEEFMRTYCAKEKEYATASEHWTQKLTDEIQRDIDRTILAKLGFPNL